MKAQRIARIQDLVGLVNALYPPFLAEEWDNVGLQAGDPAAEVKKVLVCLDPSEKALAAAEELGAQALLSHHPLIFRPLKSLVPRDETGRVLFRAVSGGIAVLCAHTNLDRARDGLNDWLAEALGLPSSVPLSPGGGNLVKLVVFVPLGHESKVAEALFEGGAGRVGGYDRCSFRTEGKGTFRPGGETSPYIGEVGRDEEVEEVRLETILPRPLISRVLSKMLKAHPYEEVAYDLIPLSNAQAEVGLGRIGKLPGATTLGEFAERVKKSLGTSFLRLVGSSGSKVRKVALCGGSGASLLAEAARQGADVLVTGDVKYHEAKIAESQGLALIDAGHFATEHLMVDGMAKALRREAAGRNLEIEFIEMKGEKDPFRLV